MSKSSSDWKNEGNAALKEKDFKKAIECYSKAIEIDQNDHTFYSNRSAAYLFSRNFTEVRCFWFWFPNFHTHTPNIYTQTTLLPYIYIYVMMMIL